MPKKTKAVKKTDQNRGWNKRESKRNPYGRKIELQKSFLIICEGTNTEPEYFKSFAQGNIAVETYGVGRSKTALVKHIITYLHNNPNARLQEVWAVFDFDRNATQLKTQKKDFDNAIALAINNKIKVAWSNDCFELWFVLHYQFVESNLDRIDYYRILSEKWNCAYHNVGKQRNFCKGIYKRLRQDELSNQNRAVKNAKKLLELHRDCTPANSFPSTTVHTLVVELNSYIEN
jgi:hypothetical protein